MRDVVFGQEQNVVSALAQRREIDLNHRKAVIKVESKPTRLALGLQIAIRGRDHADIERQIFQPSDAAKRSFFQDPKQFRLQPQLELGLQAKLLRVLEEGSFRRVGGLKDLPLDVRVVAASNRDLKSESEAGRFRLDLYYRLSVIQIDLPPLRERGDDVLLLAKYYIAHFNERLRKRIRGLTGEVEEIFRRYSWPGNVRELRNVIERVMILEDSDVITADWLPRGLIGD